MRFLWDNFPVVIIWVTGLSMLETALHTVDPPLMQAAWLSLVPLTAAFILLWFASQKKGVLTFLAWSLVLTAGYAVSLSHHTTVSLSIEAHRSIYEASVFIEFILVLLHARTWLRKHDWAWIFGITLLFGMILENGGIFTGFFREDGYLLYVPGLPAPAATMLGWVNVLYCGFFAVERILNGMKPFWRGLTCAGIALSMDIPFDPVAARLSWWVWNRELTMSVWGVPAVNYVAWFWALFPYAWCYYRVRMLKGVSEGRKMALLSALIPLILVLELGGVVLTLKILGDQGALEIVRRFFTFPRGSHDRGLHILW